MGTSTFFILRFVTIYWTGIVPDFHLIAREVYEWTRVVAEFEQAWNRIEDA